MTRQPMPPETDSRNPLGKEVAHSPVYNPGHLFSVARHDGRREIGLLAALPFGGADVWNAYEISWLNPAGKPEVAMGTFTFPCSTPNLIESKSLKLFLNSLNLHRFDSAAAVCAVLEKELAAIAGGRVGIDLITAERFHETLVSEPPGQCLDDLDVACRCDRVAPETLDTVAEQVTETVYSNLLRTNCPVTGQPDWATVVVDYTGPQINPEGLLKYLVSYRQHTGFHENCVERIFMDILTRCTPARLLVQARFTRRGGLDINPWRANYSAVPQHTRFARQ